MENTTKPTKPRYLYYLRVSKEQKKEDLQYGDFGISKIEQQNSIRDFAERNDIELVEPPYEETKTAFEKGKREVFYKMLDDLVEGKHDTEGIVFYKIDRISRNTFDNYLIENLIKEGKNILSVAERIEDSPSGRLQLRMMMAYSIYYSENLSDLKTKANYTRHINQAIHIKPKKKHLGYDWNEAIKTIEVNETEKLQVQYLYAQFLQMPNIAYTEYFDYLKAHNPEITTKDPEELKKILTDTQALRYRGLLSQNTDPHFSYNLSFFKIKEKKKFENIVVAEELRIISDELYHKVQEKIQREIARGVKRTDEGLWYEFRNIAHCTCGWSIKGYQPKKSPHVWYGCKNKNCKQKEIREIHLRALLTDTFFKHFKAKPEALEQLKILIKNQEEAEIHLLEYQLEKTKKEITKTEEFILQEEKKTRNGDDSYREQLEQMELGLDYGYLKHLQKQIQTIHTLIREKKVAIVQQEKKLLNFAQYYNDIFKGESMAEVWEANDLLNDIFNSLTLRDQEKGNKEVISFSFTEKFNELYDFTQSG